MACRESIQKRFPDSVANLLYANVVGSIPSPGSGSSLADLSAGKDASNALAQVLAEKEQYRTQVETVTLQGEQRLRSLRQVRVLLSVWCSGDCCVCVCVCVCMSVCVSVFIWCGQVWSIVYCLGIGHS